MSKTNGDKRQETVKVPKFPDLHEQPQEGYMGAVIDKIFANFSAIKEKIREMDEKITSIQEAMGSEAGTEER